MVKTCTLSIIIVAYNNQALLRQCLRSIHDNVSISLKYEIIVVDNNSADKTVAMLEKEFPEITVIANTENYGFAKANNQGLKLTTGKYILLLNNDTFVLAHSLETLIAYMEEHPKVGAASPRLLNGDGISIQAQGGGNKKQWLSKEPLSVKFITGASFLIRRDVYARLGGLDEKFFFYNEDLDWCTRILKRGWQIHYVPAASIIHYGGKSTHFISKRALIEGIKGGLYYNYKHYRWILPLYIPLLLVYCFLEIVLSLFKIMFFLKPRAAWERLQAFTILIGIILSGSFR